MDIRNIDDLGLEERGIYCGLSPFSLIKSDFFSNIYFKLHF